MKRVLVFGTFDPLHPGHLDFFRQAKALGDHLRVVVARDAVVRQNKHEPSLPETSRVAAVAECAAVDEAQLGTAELTGYPLLRELTFDVVALGYDQKPTDEEVRRILQEIGKPQVQVVRLQPYFPEQYKSSYLRPSV